MTGESGVGVICVDDEPPLLNGMKLALWSLFKCYSRWDWKLKVLVSNANYAECGSPSFQGAECWWLYNAQVLYNRTPSTGTVHTRRVGQWKSLGETYCHLGLETGGRLCLDRDSPDEHTLIVLIRRWVWLVGETGGSSLSYTTQQQSIFVWEVRN